MLPQLKSLAVFAKVAETGSFSAAASALGISAPVVSQHISKLEDNLDTALVYRSTRSLVLTDAGQKLSKHANKMLDAAETGLEELQSKITNPSGRLKIAVPTFMAAPGMTKLFSTFMDKYPEIVLEISYTVGGHNLNESGYDLAIQLGEMEDSNFMARKLIEGSACLYASPKLIEELGAIEEPEDLMTKDYPFICETGWPLIKLRRKDGTGELFERETNSRFWCDNGEAKKQMALLGKGITWLPEMYVEAELASGQLVTVLPEWTSEAVSVYAVWPKNAGSRSLTRLFLIYMGETILADMQKRTAH